MRIALPWLLALVIAAAVAPAEQSQQEQFADLGRCALVSGEFIEDCRIGYRTFGHLDRDRSNAILFPTWAGGTSEQLRSNIESGAWIDLSRYYVVAVDALANGVSSSPSNSTRQPRMRFPRITIADMVSTQHRLLTEVLGIRHLRAVMGISMGGMQTFQWMVSYPDFMDRAVPIVGSPRLAPYDLLHWQTQIDAITNDPAWSGGDYQRNPARVAEYEFGSLLLTSPARFNATHTRSQVLEEVSRAAASNTGSDANNKIRQSQAMMALDVSSGFGGSLEAAAAAVKAKVLVIVAAQDHVVTPEPAREFARLLKASLVELKGDCGHLATSCEEPAVATAVRAFLAR